MPRAARHAKPNVTVRANAVAATMKAATAPLSTLTPMMLESIAASHARRATPQFARMLADLQRIVNKRREGERDTMGRA